MKTIRFTGMLLSVCLGLSAVRADEAIPLKERFFPDYHYHVNSRVDVSGTLTLPPEKGQTSRPLAMMGKSAVEYDERVLRQGADNQVVKTVRFYSRLEFERKVGEQVQQNHLRPEVRRLVVLRHNHLEVPFAPSGPLTWGEIDMVRTDVFTPSLAGMLPERAVRPGDTWRATSAVAQELTDIDRIEEGQLSCKFEAITILSRRRHARISFSGTIRGLGEDGMAKHQLDGYFFFDLESNHLSYLTLKGRQILLDKAGKEAGRIQGTFVLTRQPHAPCAAIGDEALRGLVLEPNEDNSLLLYDNQDVGIQFLYPRRWRVAGVTGRQLGLDESHGNGGILMTIEASSRVPTATQYLQESRSFLAQQKADRVEPGAPRALRNPPFLVETFGIDAEVARQPIRLEYYVIRQALGGATLAARLLPTDLPALQQDVRRIAESIRITRRQ